MQPTRNVGTHSVGTHNDATIALPSASHTKPSLKAPMLVSAAVLSLAGAMLPSFLATQEGPSQKVGLVSGGDSIARESSALKHSSPKPSASAMGEIVSAKASTQDLKFPGSDKAQSSVKWIEAAGGSFEVVTIPSFISLAEVAVEDEALYKRIAALNGGVIEPKQLAEAIAMIAQETTITPHDRALLEQLLSADRVHEPHLWVVANDAAFGGIRVRLLIRTSALPEKFSFEPDQGFFGSFVDASGTSHNGLTSPYTTKDGKGFLLPKGAQGVSISFIAKQELWKVALDARTSRSETEIDASPALLPLSIPDLEVGNLSARGRVLAERVQLGMLAAPNRLTKLSSERPTVVVFGFPQCGSCKLLIKQLHDQLATKPEAFDVVLVSVEVIEPKADQPVAAHPAGSIVIPFAASEDAMLQLRGANSHLAFPFSYVFVPSAGPDSTAKLAGPLVVGANLDEIMLQVSSRRPQPQVISQSK